ncbi:MAG: hypothetical protein QOH60_2140 [Mycobacterium sp.]|jgi:hypothetical protein|nr:hypothetical protein [Mycobacterium sp.]
MQRPFIGQEALAEGVLTPHLLRSRFVAIYPGIYVPKSAEITAAVRAEAGWLWSRRQGIVAGLSASALHGARWISDTRPAEVIHANSHPPSRLHAWTDQIADDEITHVLGISLTNAARTALDLACRYPVDEAVAAVDALARATKLKPAAVELLAERYPGRRGMKRARITLGLVDAGSESPRETWLRLLLIRAGFPRPETQLAIYDEYGQLIRSADMGWRELKLAVEYDGDHHRTSRRQIAKDIRDMELLAQLGWHVVHVTSEDCGPDIVRRVGDARASRI